MIGALDYNTKVSVDTRPQVKLLHPPIYTYCVDYFGVRLQKECPFGKYSACLFGHKAL